MLDKRVAESGRIGRAEFSEDELITKVAMASAVMSLGWALALWPQVGLSQSDRDYVFADTEGHLVIRFVGSGATGLNPSQAEEILNAELSSMVHDHLRADLLFEEETRDSEWAASMEPRLVEHVMGIDLEFPEVLAECRAASCRVIMTQPGHWTVPRHRDVLDTVQSALEDFIAAHAEAFRSTFMLTAYYQDFETPHVKAFLERTRLHAGADSRQ